MISGRKRWLLIAVVVAATLIAWFSQSVAVIRDAPTVAVRRDQFRVFHLEAGEIRAARGEKVSSPRVRGDLKIVRLWPEGSRVEVGDLLLQFDRSQHEQWLKDAASDLEKAKADRERDETLPRHRDLHARDIEKVSDTRERVRSSVVRMNLTGARWTSY